MTRSTLRRRCEERLDALPLPNPFDLTALQDELARRRGRPLTVHDLPWSSSSAPSGVWVATDQADYVFVDQDARPLHREHIVLHELAHIVCDHDGAAVLSEDAVSALLPSLDATVVARVLGRTHYSDEEEQEAELLATLIAERAGRATGPAVDRPTAALRARLRAALG